MDTTATNRKIREILTAVQNETLIINPVFQRRLVWKNQDKCSFIQTVLDGYPFPEIFVATGNIDLESGEGTELLVDGQQRVSTLCQYFRGSELLQLGSQLSKYADLSEDQKTRFLQYDVVVRDLGEIGDPEIRRVFQRINSTGYSLNAMEVQNSRFDGEYKQTAEEIASDDFFDLHRFFRVNDIRRMDDMRFVLAYMTTVLSTYFNQDNGIREFLEMYNEGFPQSSEIKTKSKKVLEFIESCNFEPSSRVWNHANMFTLLVETYKAMTIQGLGLDPERLGPKLAEFYERVRSVETRGETAPQIVEYRQATIQNTNGRASRIRRGKMIEDLLGL